MWQMQNPWRGGGGRKGLLALVWHDLPNSLVVSASWSHANKTVLPLCPIGYSLLAVGLLKARMLQQSYWRKALESPLQMACPSPRLSVTTLKRALARPASKLIPVPGLSATALEGLCWS